MLMILQHFSFELSPSYSHAPKTGTSPRLIIKDLEMMKEVLINKLAHFGKPHLGSLILILTRGLTTLEGEAWANRRKMINPAFHIEKLKGMVLVELTIEAMMSLVINIPGFRFIPTKRNQRRNTLYKEITSKLRNVVQRKKDAIKTGQSVADHDLLSMLLQYSHVESASSTERSRLTVEDVIEECNQFYIAGQETTSSWLTWTIIVLAMHPEWQDKAREEVLQVCQKKVPDPETLSHLKIVTMVLYEVLRLYPPVIAQYQHTYKETRVGDI